MTMMTHPDKLLFVRLLHVLLLLVLLPDAVTSQAVTQLSTNPCENWENNRDNFAAAKALWVAASPACYDFAYTFRGFQIGTPTPKPVRVRDDQLDMANSLGWRTVDYFLDLIESHCVASCPTAGAQKCSVMYDTEFGYPKTLYIDQSEFEADEEYIYSLTDFQIVDCNPAEEVASEAQVVDIGDEGTLLNELEDDKQATGEMPSDHEGEAEGDQQEAEETLLDESEQDHGAGESEEQSLLDLLDLFDLDDDERASDPEAAETLLKEDEQEESSTKCDASNVVNDWNSAMETWDEPHCYDYIYQRSDPFGREQPPVPVRIRGKNVFTSAADFTTKSTEPSIRDWLKRIEIYCIDVDDPTTNCGDSQCNVTYAEQGYPTAISIPAKTTHDGFSMPFDITIANFETVSCFEGQLPTTIGRPIGSILSHLTPSQVPSDAPSLSPTQPENQALAESETMNLSPVQQPSQKPDQDGAPSSSPIQQPSQEPRQSEMPSSSPVQQPSHAPVRSEAPSLSPVQQPTQAPSPGQTSSPTKPPTMPPSKSPTEKPPPHANTARSRLQEVQAYLATKGISARRHLQLPGTPQYRASAWVANVDPMNVAVPAPTDGNGIAVRANSIRLEQRYILAVLYYALEGENWSFSMNFLSGEPECSWFQVVNNDLEFSRLVNLMVMGVKCSSNQLEISSIKMPGNGLVGVLPVEIGYLQSLKILELSSNSLSGGLPDTMQYLTQLVQFSASQNELRGPLPQWVSRWSNLETLSVSNNLLTGSVGALSLLPELREIFLSDNAFSRGIESFQNLKKLEILDLAENVFAGQVPEYLYNVPFVDLHGNVLTGELPEASALMGYAIEFLSLYQNRLTATIPSSMGKLQRLFHLDLSYNSLRGSIPASLGGLTNLEHLFLARNPFDAGSIPLLYTPKLKDMSLKGTNRVGRIPAQLASLGNLVLLDLQDNALTGTIPSEFGAFGEMRFLMLNENELSGTIPESLQNLNDLAMLLVDKNNLVGTVGGICDKFGPQHLSVVAADCDEVECACCNMCCSDADLTCNSMELFVSFVDGFKREQYVFGPDLMFMDGESEQMTPLPSFSPTMSPTIRVETRAPTSAPTTESPSRAPSPAPSSAKVTGAPSKVSSFAPSTALSTAPSLVSSAAPSLVSSTAPSLRWSTAPTIAPSSAPSIVPSLPPTLNPTVEPASVDLRTFYVDISVTGGELDRDAFRDIFESYLTDQMSEAFDNFLRLKLFAVAPPVGRHRHHQRRHLQEEQQAPALVFTALSGKAYFSGTAPEEYVVSTVQTVALEDTKSIHKLLADKVDDIGVDQIVLHAIEVVMTSHPVVRPTLAPSVSPVAPTTQPTTQKDASSSSSSLSAATTRHTHIARALVATTTAIWLMMVV